MHTARAGRLSPSRPLCGAGWVLGEPLGSTDPHVGPCHTRSLSHTQQGSSKPSYKPPGRHPWWCGAGQSRGTAVTSVTSPGGTPEEHPRCPVSLLATHPVPPPLVSPHRPKTQQPCPAGC